MGTAGVCQDTDCPFKHRIQGNVWYSKNMREPRKQGQRTTAFVQSPESRPSNGPGRKGHEREGTAGNTASLHLERSSENLLKNDGKESHKADSPLSHLQDRTPLGTQLWVDPKEHRCRRASGGDLGAMSSDSLGH